MNASPESPLALDGPAAPPMANGEVIFEEPWQGRVFGMARALCEAGHYDWDEFRDKLIAEIALHDGSGQTYRYFDHFHAALQSLLVEKSLLGADDIARRTEEFAARPHGHDHQHPA